MAKHPSTVPAKSTHDALTEDVLDGLKKQPKQLSPVWFYDELGSFLFDNICELPEYYITRTELQIMHGHAAEMAQHIGPEAAMIEFGSGTSLKTRLLLDQLENPLAYVPVDISREHLFSAAGALAKDYPNLHILPVCADFTQNFELPQFIRTAPRRIVYFPGSTLGNFEQSQARQLLARMRELVGQNGAVLIGIDLRKDPRVLERAYDDAAGVTAEFNINALRHVNRELGADFDLDAFDHLAVWVENESRIEMHLVSKREQVVHLGGEKVRISRGEHLRTEYCHKYTLDSFAELAATAGLAVKRVWMDPNKQFSVQLLEPARLQ
ncbi:L-histidine N(alpha)-methyltransferase [Steroidobacter sp.]|uniref:L-histidine N(alpha)-methyltransferase n=1 Tax=Steroidobacter sp. TaxID=1978227 RepID=UPI001A3D5BB7|nr:L-histidine N(alpha)-methyltransferase [Steroidobacter sp.]MBL8269304.1 L-histidine N(alpha)-methyltransferase [Steroidobacter sp.]